MKLSPISLLSAIALACAVCLLFGYPNAVQAQVLISDFEAEEGFTAGETAKGKGGWSTNVGSNFFVVGDYAQSGSQSLRVMEGSTSRIDSPDLSHLGVAGVALWLSTPETAFRSSLSFARFRIIIGEADGIEQRALEFTFMYHGTDVPGYRLKYRNWAGEDGAATDYQSLSSTLINPADWNQFRFLADFESLTYSVWISDTRILTDIPIGGTATSSSVIQQIQFWGHGSSGGEVYAYYDNITGISQVPEPSSVAFLGGVVLAGWMVFSRRSKIVA